MKREKSDYCERCAESVVAVRPHPGWLVASVGAFGFFVLTAFAVGASGFLLFGAGFVHFALGALVLGPLHERASDPPRCPHCRCVIVAQRRPNDAPVADRSQRRQAA
jgi:hypothetical protein